MASCLMRGEFEASVWGDSVDITSKLSVGLFEITEPHHQLFTWHAFLVPQMVSGSVRGRETRS